MLSRKNYTFLVIDDNPADVGVLRRNLQKITQFNSHIIPVPDYESAVEILTEKPIDCVFLDYRLGGQSGLSILKKLRNSGENVPMIACTGQGDESVAAELMKSGAQDYLPKQYINPGSLFHMVTNAIDKVRLEKNLKEKQEELEAFVAVSSHDLKAPLRRIAAFSELVKEEYTQNQLDDSESIITYIDSIIDNASYMSALIQNLLNYAQLECPDNKFEDTDLDVVVNEILSILQPVIEESRANIHVKRLPKVTGDPIGLTQLFQNLISNAIKFRRSDAHPYITIDSEREGVFWKISLTDNGIGIRPEYHTAIFSPMKRLHTEREYEGTGMGLAICKKIVQRHGGRIWIDSEFGTGTTFHFTLSTKP